MRAIDPNVADRLFDDNDKDPINPYHVFELWYAEAEEKEENDPNAMALATVDANGLPDIRMVLMNGRDERGFVFFTNFESAKGVQLANNPKAALNFHWKSLRRQVRIRGAVEPVSGGEADAYFATRARDSRLGAHVSQQSRPLQSRADLVFKVEDLRNRLNEKPVPRPSHWSGFRVIPEQIEFWSDGAFRLHDRVLFTRSGPKGEWTRQRLYP